MKNSTNRSCPQCGAAIAHGSLQGLCPNCLALVAFGSDPDDQQTVISSPTTGSEVAPPTGDQRSAKPLISPVLRYFGDYELLEEIARGGMGVVYRARQVSLNRIVAVKMILAEQLASEVELRRFHAEAEAAANLQHPNIVAIHEVGEHDGRHYFSMDFVDGQNMARMTNRGPLPAVKAANLVKTIAEAVQFAHQRGILHRDLKPQNVLIDAHGIPRITDFGLAKQVNRDSSLTMEGAVMGSPSYMPPEQAAARQDLLGPVSDVYSLGAILYELLTGCPPFRGETPMDTLRQVIDNDPALPSKLNPKVPADLETICLKCLEKKPSHRYSSARALAEELGRFVNHEPILARPASAFRKASAWFQRHPWTVSAGLALLVLGLTALAFGFWDKSRYLVWLQTHTPPKKPVEGTWFIVSTTALLPLCLFMAPFVFLDFVDRKRRGFPLLVTHLRVYSILALPGLVASINFTLSLVHEVVWHRSPTAWLLFFAFPGSWFGALLIWNVVKEYRSFQFGEDRPEAAVLFPPKPKESWKLRPGTIGDRKAFNSVALAVIAASVWINFAGGLVSTNVDASRLFTMVAGATGWSWLILYWWRNTNSAAKHVILLWGLLQFAFPLTFVGVISTDERYQSMFRVSGVQWIALGMGLSLGWFVQQVISVVKPIKTNETTVETADYPWVRVNRGFFLLSVGLAFILLLLSARFWVSSSSANSPPLLAFLCFLLFLEFVSFLRSAGIERNARRQSLIVWLLACLAASLGLPAEQAGREVVAGLTLGCAMLAFIGWKSKAQKPQLAGS